MSWIAGIFELLGGWIVGNKNKWGFVLNITCCLLWIIHVTISRESPGLLVVVIPMFFINIRNFIKWSKKPNKSENSGKNPTEQKT